MELEALGCVVVSYYEVLIFLLHLYILSSIIFALSGMSNYHKIGISKTVSRICWFQALYVGERKGQQQSINASLIVEKL